MSDYAIRLGVTGGPEVLRIDPIELPPPDPDEVRIRQTAIEVGHDDVLVRNGSVPVALPAGLGSSAVGVVEAAGSRAGFAVGDRVAYATVPFGAYATVRNVPAAALVPLPDAVGDEDAAAVLANGLLVWALIRRVHRVRAGETVVFHGAADGVGLVAGQWLSHLGARPIGTVSSTHEVRLAIDNGYDEVVLDHSDDLAARARDLTDGVGAAVVYDPLGISTIEASTAALGPDGLLVSSGLRLTAYLPDTTALRAASAEVLDLVVRGAIRPNLRQRFDLADAGKAQEALEARAAVGATVLLP